MRLKYVKIKNFRSIKDCTVEFDPTCRILAGINEAGKSNILNALALLCEGYSPVKKDDVREPSPYGEEPVVESYVRFSFSLEKAESDALFNAISEKILAGANTFKLATDGTASLTLKDLCHARNEGLYIANIIDETKSVGAVALPTPLQLVGEWKKPSKLCPPGYTFELEGESYLLAHFQLVKAADCKEIPETHLEDATIKDFSSLYYKSINAITKENLPDALFWEYEEKNILPNSITIASFSNSPDSCLPLKNMFLLAGHKDIKLAIAEAQKGTPNQFQNFFDRVANRTTAHFRNVWKDYKDIEFTLRLNADHIIPGIKELNSFDFAKRSDGFKRFVTFLLMISANVRSEDLRNTLLLIDEPETGLHPTGSRYLRDELIRISKSNYVVYSTHSIFMIDPGEIGRHYLVKKDEEITTIESAIESNIAEEEVIYNALGHSIFETLKKKNIIFEGWKDKRLFQVALDNSNAETKKKFKDVGICHAKGARSIKAITPLMELANRECLIISDSDKPAKDQQKLYKQEKGYGKWNHYQDINSKIEAITGEDFLDNDYIVKQITHVLTDAALPSFDPSILPNKKNKLAAIKKWLTANGYTDEQTNDTLLKIKDSLFESLKPLHIDSSYSELLLGITKAIS